MSLFSWLTRKSKPQAPHRRQGAPSSVLLNADATVPLAGRNAKPAEPQPSQQEQAARKNERMERRELLYTVVRDAMVRAGVLSAGYKFKVLSLDQRGAQFLVMMDLAKEYGGDTARLSEIEALIAQTAKSRFDILVTAVYWRSNEHVAVGVPPRPAAVPAQAQQAPTAAAPASPVIAAPVIAAPRAAAPRPHNPVLASRPAPLVPPAPPAPVRAAPRFEPIEADEVAAFKQALTSAAARSVPAPAALGVVTRSGPLLPQAAPTGFEDTVMPGQDGRSPDLSTTQYGDLN